MAKKNLNAAVLIMLFALFCINFTSCNSKKESNKQIFELKGELKGLKDGKLEVRFYSEEEFIDSIQVKDGKFEYKRDVPVPDEISLVYGDYQWIARFFAENSKMTLVGDLKNMRGTKVTGGKFQEAKNQYSKAAKEYTKKNGSLMELQFKQYDPKLTKKEKAAAEKEFKEAENKYHQFQRDFIKKNPTNPYGACIIWDRLTTKSGGESAKELKVWADPISPSIRKHPYVAKMFKMLNLMLKTEAGLSKFVAGAANVKYKVDKTYQGNIHKNVTYLSIFSNNNLCALSGTAGIHKRGGKPGQKDEFFVQIISPKGKELSRFIPQGKGVPSVLAVDQSDNIYVLNTERELIVKKSRGREVKYFKDKGAVCYIYNKKGKLLKEFKLEGLKKATGARIYKDNLLVTDNSSNKLVIFNKETGKPSNTIADLRPCCSILDFDVDTKGQIIVANLGSFRVDGYDFSGKKLVSFGQRGKGINDFTGCCNPVSVRKISNGAIITVEKTPTRIKVYSKDGAHTIKGIEELVKGCFHIPIMSDSNNNIYLASPEKGLVKCVVM